MAYLSNLAKVTGLASTTIRQRNDSLPESSPISRSSTQSGSGPESPTDRITRGRNRSSPAKDAALHKVNGGKIAKPSNDKHNRRSSFWSGLASFFGSSKTTEGDDLDGDTIVNSDDSMETVEQDDDDTLVPHRPRRAELLYKTALEGRKRHRDEQVLRSDAPPPTQWTGDESRLVANIKTRGRKPLFDRTWFMDFSYFPDSAFTADPDEALIKHNHCTIYRGKFPP